MKYFYLILFVAFSILSCSKSQYTLKEYSYPKPVDTTNRPIKYQEKRSYFIEGVGATNQFPAARLNDFFQLDDSTYQATISPENTPINNSPWYAFKIWAETPREIYLKLLYTEHEHRYNPKLSLDGKNWESLDSNLIKLDADSVHATMKIRVTPDTLWVAAQEIEDHKRVGDWVKSFDGKKNVTVGNAGISKQGRSMYYMNITKGENTKKPTIVVISRQHPPEVTGYYAMQSFIERIIEQGDKNGFLEKYRVMVYPLMNPDGVDLGHHRHNTGGIDMNRDWAQYNQREVKLVVNHIVEEAKEHKNNVILGLDFHSTHYDVYYTYDESVKRKLPGFTKEWLSRIQTALELDDINEQPSGLNQPISKGWFFKQFGAESITYEIGDGTPRDFIKVKGEVSADAMMNILLEKGKKWKLNID